MRSAKGSITKLGASRWRVSVEAAPDPETGKRRRVTKVVRGSRKLAEETKLRMLVEQGADVVDSSLTLKEFVDAAYIPAKETLIELGKFKRSTLASYQDRLRLYVYPTFADTPLKDISAQKVRHWLSSMDKPTKAKEALKTLSSVLSFAVYDMQLRDNPCKRVKPPETAGYTPHPLDLEDIEVYRYWFRDTTIEAAVLLAIGGGFRRGDHLPMSITRRLAQILPESGPVLKGHDGRMYPSAVSRQYKRIQATMPPEVPRIPLKDLRHSSLTLAYESGAEALALKDRGGHSNIDTTRRYYVRPKGNRDAEIARAMDELLSPKPQNDGYLYAIYGDTVADF